MNKTVYYYNLNMFSYDNDVKQRIPVQRSRAELMRFIDQLPFEQEILDEVAAGMEIAENEVNEIEREERENPIHVFDNLNENGRVFWEIISRDDEYIFGLLGKNIETFVHLRNTRTNRSRDISREANEQLEAATFFVINLDTMVCALFRESGAPTIEEMNKLFYRVPGFTNFEVSMSKMINQDVIESIARKDVFATLEYEIEIPNDRFFQYIDLDREEIEKIQNEGTTKLVVNLASTGRDDSLLQDSSYEEKRTFVQSFIQTLRRGNGNKAKIGAKDNGQRKQEYSLLDDQITLKNQCNLNYEIVNRRLRENPEQLYSEILFEYFRERLIESLRMIE